MKEKITLKQEERQKAIFAFRLFALYSFITSEKLVDDYNLVIVGKKDFILIFSIYCFLLIIIFYTKKIINHFQINIANYCSLPCI